MNENQVIHQLTPRQFGLYKTAFQIIRHHAIDLFEYQKKHEKNQEYWVGSVMAETKQLLDIDFENKYLIRLSDIVSIKSKVSNIAGTFDVNDSEQNYMLWKALTCVIEILELLYAEILYDDNDIQIDEVIEGIKDGINQM